MMRTLICSAVALLLGCATAPPKPEGRSRQDASAWFSLELGTRWTYEARQLGEARTIDVELTRRTDDGFLEDSTGAQFRTDAYGVRDQKRYLLRNPVEAGTKWTNVVSVQTLEQYEIVGAGQPCDAPAGSWPDCVIVESRVRVQEGTTLVNEMTLAPGVGIVRISTVLEAGGKQIPQATLTLQRFTRPGLPERP